ncbi:hypothetical protein BDQ12DRAFT_742264 [Crucibulum laeve]|uniref:FAM72 protein-domain-containing protein n=1 Tax=Crucibulum laeve TaxID=68775 RepID=A0A5C3MJF7_9AGAR|nr:hypothetical protein BDQ12DRAFT_742264 [Crucibulum laeve]
MPAIIPRHDPPPPRTYSSPRPPRPAHDRLHDPSFAHILYDNRHLSFNPQAPSAPPMFSYLAHSNSWQNQQVHLFPSNPYPAPAPLPIAHKVWILDCKSCDTFITNRGMKAVLLLRPNVSLYSSDAFPAGCSTHTSNPDALRSRASRASSSSAPSRTCECLTQTLFCHGCGNPVGYMIVIPCSRCTSSITATNRATNGHRFVFHASEVTGSERHYIADEAGVIPCEPSAIVTSSLPNSTWPGQQNPSYPPPYVGLREPHASHQYSDQSNAFTRSSSPSLRSDYLPTPPLEFADPMLASSTLSSSHSTSYPTENDVTDVYPPQHASTYHSELDRGILALQLRPLSPSAPMRASSPLQRPSSAGSLASDNSDPPPLPQLSFLTDMPADHKEAPAPRILKEGDILFWHHLATSGEIPGVADNKRARKPVITPNKVVSKSMMFNR